MKKFLKHAKEIWETVKNALTIKGRSVAAAAGAAYMKLQESSGNFVMDHAVVFVVIIVLGGIALVLLTAFLQNDMATVLRQKIMEFFS